MYLAGVGRLRSPMWAWASDKNGLSVDTRPTLTQVVWGEMNVLFTLISG